ncbi:hypothetical protein [Aquibium sp. ELW1220]|uniref:hypothetical protein n=1 Tax=Aquibium sp. ELW1220 TaxID=2976766 RepID=UPI0025B0F6A4|nr:hypothetical protein [Aquibium sp. ELW1220]MDN2581770.1 hypothetical protein [Aquibium sp. ELW1220]
MFWRPRSPLDADDEAWILDCWNWLSASFPAPSDAGPRPLVLPTRDFFTPARGDDRTVAGACFGQVARLFGLDPAAFDLVEQDASIDPVLGPLQVVQNAPAAPAGTFTTGQGGRLIVSYDPALVARPIHLIATFAHEICHPLLLSIDEAPPGGEEMEEFATDLAVTFFGFGVFNCNSASSFRGYRDAATGTEGWSFERLGYLSPAERAFALALFVHRRPQDAADLRTHLEPGCLAYFRKAEKYLADNPAVTAGLSASR